MGLFSRALNRYNSLTGPTREMQARYGPLLNVEIALPQHLAQQYVAQEKQVPVPMKGLALIDTGASCCSIDIAAATNLGVAPVDMRRVNTPSGIEDQLVYPCLINCAEGPFRFVTNTALASKHLLVNQGIIALLGRDLLMNTVLIYDGKNGSFTLAW